MALLSARKDTRFSHHWPTCVFIVRLPRDDICLRGRNYNYKTSGVVWWNPWNPSPRISIGEISPCRHILGCQHLLQVQPQDDPLFWRKEGWLRRRWYLWKLTHWNRLLFLVLKKKEGQLRTNTYALKSPFFFLFWSKKKSNWGGILTHWNRLSFSLSTLGSCHCLSLASPEYDDHSAKTILRTDFCRGICDVGEYVDNKHHP